MFSQDSITDVRPPRFRGGQMHLSWTSTASAGTWFQLYLDGALAWHGTARTCALPAPHTRHRVDLGTVSASERATDLSATLPTRPATRAALAWTGGRYLKETLAGYRIYGSAAAGGAVDYTRVLATVPVFGAGVPTDGYGMGGYGMGGYGRAAVAYAWTSDSLAGGAWTFAIVPLDRAGLAGTPATVVVAITAPPAPPARAADGARLSLTYSSSTRKATLTWGASPG